MEENQESKVEEVKMEETESVKTESCTKEKKINGIVGAVIGTMIFLGVVAIAIAIAMM